MNIQKIAVAVGIVAGASLIPGAIAAEPAVSPAPQRLAQIELTEPTTDSCVLLQEVATGQTEVRRRIENRIILRNNWHLDFLVPNEPTFTYFVALFTPENTAGYWMDIHLRQSHGGTEKVFSERADVQTGETIAIPFESPTGRQPAIVNTRIGGVNGNFYNLSIAACE
jgi:hypothetical protein